jgi:hypothetical protein
VPITTNEILIPKKIFTSRVDKDLELDATIPEFSPDVSRIVKVDCTPFTESISIQDGKAVLKGKAVYDILYETDYKRRLRCCNFTQEFSQTVPVPKSNAANLQAFAETDCERISCKLLSPRRVSVKVGLATRFDIEGEMPVKAVAVTEDRSAFFRKKTIGFDGKTATHESTYKFSEMLTLTQSEKAIGEIVCGRIDIRTPALTLSPGRAEIKTVATVHVLCEEENGDGKYFTSVKTLPINIDYSNDAIEEHKQISAKLTPIDCTFSPELDQYGESRVIKSDFSLGLCLKINEQFAHTVADDMFEKDYDSTPVRVSVALPHAHSKTESSFSTEAKLPALSPKPEALLDAGARSFGTSSQAVDDGVKTSGTFVVTLLCDTAEGVQSFDCPLPFERVFAQEFPADPSSVTADITPDEVVATLHSDGSATVRIIATARICVYTESEDSFISEVTKRTARSEESDEPMLVYCFPTEDEDLWSIAKLYRTDPESIKATNPSHFDESGALYDRSKPILVKT